MTLGSIVRKKDNDKLMVVGHVYEEDICDYGFVASKGDLTCYYCENNNIKLIELEPYCVDIVEETVNETFSVGDLVTLKIGNEKFVVCEVAENDIWVKGSSSPYPSCIFKKVQ